MPDKLDPYVVGDVNTHIDHMVKDAMRPVSPVLWEALDVPPSIRNHPNINEGQINGVVALMNVHDARPNFIEVVDINGCFAVRVQFGKQVKLITKSQGGSPLYNMESPMDLELIGRMMGNDNIQ